jgi:hypothetical protein
VKLCALVIVALTLTVGQSRAGAQQACTASLTFDTFTVVIDTDENPPYPRPDRWTIHVYSHVNAVPGKVSPTKDGGVVGDTGASRAFDTQMISNQVVGELGGSVRFRIRGGPIASRIKERDGDGVYPRDIGVFSFDDTIPCIPGVYSYTLDVPIPANPGGATGEHDGLIGLRFTLTLS